MESEQLAAVRTRMMNGGLTERTSRGSSLRLQAPPLDFLSWIRLDIPAGDRRCWNSRHLDSMLDANLLRMASSTSRVVICAGGGTRAANEMLIQQQRHHHRHHPGTAGRLLISRLEPSLCQLVYVRKSLISDVPVSLNLLLVL